MARERLGWGMIIDDRTLGEIRLIKLIDRHFWILTTYFLFLLGIWFWLSLRNGGRLVMAITLLLMSTPLFLYMRASLHISSKLSVLY